VDRAICLVPSPSATLSVPAARLASIDLLRVLAAVGIIWFHTDGAPGQQIGYAGLPIFLLIYFSLITKQSGARTIAQFLQRRWDRLLKPWLFWCGVYGACRLVKAAYVLDWSSLTRMFSAETLLAGTCIHLWYLPYAFASGLLVYLFNKRIQRLNDTLVALAATIAGVLLLPVCTLSLQAHDLPRPLPQWEFALATIPLGLALGRALSTPSRRMQGLLLSMISGTTLAACVILIALRLNALAIPYGLAVALVCFAYSWPVNGNGFVTTVAPLTLGIYLLHPLVTLGVTHFFPAQGHYPAFIIVTACVSGAVTWGLMRTPLRRFV
jgi:peptidoglycan/LPS O-acetylase OafA/YrhL